MNPSDIHRLLPFTLPNNSKTQATKPINTKLGTPILQRSSTLGRHKLINNAKIFGHSTRKVIYVTKAIETYWHRC